ncbi:ATP-dependent DNA helicase Q5-like isoform X2 [Montipora capricornis]|uniref:ATP-dependent DNA helicase Q5-like isoform X2 n=1 Tax=Montipora capricornis TaxID=246305 RepID=UPI0035F1C105
MAEDGESSLDHAFVKVCDIFGFEKLNKHQEEAIRQVVELKVDVYVNLPTGYGKSVVFQALPTVFASVNKCEKNIVIVISPLINLMKDQVSRLSLLGVSAISLSDISSAAEIKRVESGEFSIVYGSPESWLGDIRWRRMLASETYRSYVRAVAVDEAHVICHWGKSKSNNLAAFRVWFSRLHEMRSLLPRTPFVALTATATKDTRDTIFEVLIMKEPHIVEENPNKPNIAYVVKYMERNARLSDYFHWIAKENPAHLCCDYCSVMCECGTYECKPLAYPLCRADLHLNSKRKRTSTEEQKTTLVNKLAAYHKKLHTNLLQRDASGKMKFFTNPKFLLGFSDLQIQQVAEHCNELFSVSDICTVVEIWDMQHAFEIHAVMQEVFGDMLDIELSSEDECSDEESDFLGNDWNDLVVDDELANMVIDNLSFSQWDESADESADEQLDAGVPFAALNAVLNLSFDAVLNK